MLDSLAVKQRGQSRATRLHSVQTLRCRHGSSNTAATLLRHALQLGPDATTTRSGSIYADSASSVSRPQPLPLPSSGDVLSCPPQIMACCNCACSDTAAVSWALAFACQTWTSMVSWAARASSSAFRRLAFSTSASFFLILLVTTSSAAPRSAR